MIYPRIATRIYAGVCAPDLRRGGGAVRLGTDRNSDRVIELTVLMCVWSLAEPWVQTAWDEIKSVTHRQLCITVAATVTLVYQ